MTLTAAGFPGSVNDIQWATLMDLIGNDGTVGMNVSAAGGDRTVSVSSGVSNAGGILATLDASQNEGPLPANTSSNPRIDRIILRARWSTRLLQVTHRAGTPSPSPKPPTLVRDRGVQWEVSLAQVRVDPGQGAITSGDITRENTPPAAGFYYINSIATAPDPELGALIYYAPQKSLRIGTSSGYVEIAGAKIVPADQRSTQTFTFSNSSPSATSGGANPLGQAFIAPPLGIVKVRVAGRVSQQQDGGVSLLGWELRTGATIGGGSVVSPWGANANYAIEVGGVVETGQPLRMGMERTTRVFGLTAGSQYHVRAMHWGDVAPGGQIRYREVAVDPVYDY